MITANVILGLVIISIIFLIYYVFNSSPNANIEQSRFYRFITLLAGVASFFIALSLYYQAKTQEITDKKQLENSTIQIIKDLWLSPNEQLAKNYSLLGSLPQEYYPDQDVSNKTLMNQLYFAIKTFQIFEDYKTIFSQDKTGLYVWLGNFLQWTQSNTLKEIWDKIKFNFKKSTIVFTEFLFKNANKLKELRKQLNRPLLPEDYDKLIKEIESEARNILETPDKKYEKEMR